MYGRFSTNTYEMIKFAIWRDTLHDVLSIASQAPQWKIIIILDWWDDKKKLDTIEEEEEEEEHKKDNVQQLRASNLKCVRK